MENRELVEKVLAGDEAAQGRFLGLYQARLRRTCVHFLGWQDPDCDDLVQETFLLAFKNIHQFDFSRDIYSWLNRICVHLCFRRLKERQRQVTHSAEGLELASVGLARQRFQDGQEAVLRQEARGLLRRAVDRLSARCRELISLRDYDGLPYAQIAKRMKLGPGTLFSALSRCREALRQQLQAGEA